MTDTMKNVKIKVIGSQMDYMKKEEKIELLTEASLFKKDDFYYVIYDESSLVGMEGSKTRLKIEDNKLTMTRFGPNSSIMEFKKGERYNTTYLTKYGQFDIEILTTNYEQTVIDNGSGTIDLEYKMNLAGVNESLNRLHIEIQ